MNSVTKPSWPRRWRPAALREALHPRRHADGASASACTRRSQIASVLAAGSYRLIYRVDDEQQRVIVVGAFARADAYRPR